VASAENASHFRKSKIFLQEHCIIKTLCCGTDSGFAAYKGLRL
jgi:hypothetical protein